MKSLDTYMNINEAVKKTSKLRDSIQFTIWQRPEKKIKWLSNNDKYQKIEYKYEDLMKDFGPWLATCKNMNVRFYQEQVMIPE